MGSPSPRLLPTGAAFDALYKEHVRAVSALVRRCGVREADVQDLAQEVFILLYRALLGGLDTTHSLWRWLRRTCFRKVRDHRKLPREREQPARGGAIELADLAGVAPTPEDVIMEISAWENVDAVLDMLPREQRLVLVMSEMEEMSNREIAEDLEIPEGTVATRLAAARKSARAAWEKRRASGLMAVAPFALWDFDSLVKHSAAPPPLPPGFEDEVWRGIVQRIPELAASGATAASTAAPKVLTAMQAAAGFVLAAILGAGIALLLSAHDPPTDASACLGPPSVQGSAATSPALASVAPPPAASVAPTTTASASATASASTVPDLDASDRMALAEARAAIAQEDYAVARAALRRVRGARFVVERDALLLDVAAHLDGGR